VPGAWHYASGASPSCLAVSCGRWHSEARHAIGPRFGSVSRVVLAMPGVRLACLARLIRCAHPFGAACRQSVSLRSALALRTVTDRRGDPNPPAPNRSRHRTNGRPNGFPSAASDAIFRFPFRPKPTEPMKHQRVAALLTQYRDQQQRLRDKGLVLLACPITLGGGNPLNKQCPPPPHQLLIWHLPPADGIPAGGSSLDG